MTDLPDDDLGPRMRLALVPGVTPHKWTRVWADRRRDLPLEVFPIHEAEQRDVLVDGRADVALVRLPIDRDDLGVIPLYTEQPVVVLWQEHELAEAGSIDVAQLAGEHLLQDPDDVPEWRDVATEIADGSRLPLPRLRDLDEAAEQVAAGVGILVLPQSIARVHNRKDVTQVPVTGVAETQIALAWRSDRMGKDIDDFIGVVRGRSAASTRGAVDEEALAAAEAEAKAARAAKHRERQQARKAAAKAKAPTKPVAQRYQPKKTRRGK